MNQIEQLARHVREVHNNAIDDELRRMMDAGIEPSSIALEHHPDCATVITVNGEPVSRWMVAYVGGSVFVKTNHSEIAWLRGEP